MTHVIKETIYTKTANKWTETYTTTDRTEVYENLTQILISKKMFNCTYITRITQYSNYDGTRTVTVYYDNGVKAVFVIKA